MRLIDADALKELIRSKSDGPEDLWDTMGVLNAINNIPIIVWCNQTSDGLPLLDLRERPQGEWINHRNDYGHNIADCSECGKTMQWHDEDEDGIPKYCWYCGARMKGGAE